MRRTVGFVALASTGLLTSAVALAPTAGGATRVSGRQVAATNGRSTPTRCTPKYVVVASQKFGGANPVIEGGLEDVVEADKTHAYAVGVTETENPLLKTGTFNGIVDQGDGKHWAFDNDPGGSLTNDILVSVDATANTNVWADGLSFGSKNGIPSAIVLHKNAAGWHHVALPDSKMTELLSVVTVSPDDVYVGGVTVSGAMETEVPVVFHFNGKSWHRTVFSGMTDKGVAAMTLAGKTVVVAMTDEAAGSGGSKTASSSVEYLAGSKWKPLAFEPKAGISSLSGSSIHDLWAATVDEKDDATDVVYHRVKQWTRVVVSDDNVHGISERTTNPDGVWVAGHTTSDDPYGALDVLRNSGPVAGSIEIPADTFEFFSIDAHIPNRVLAVGDSTDTDGTVRTLIEQASC